MTVPLTHAQQALVLEWRPLAFKIVNRFVSRFGRLRTAREDLDSAAIEGLCVAASHFKPKPGVQFQTYAYWWVDYHVQMAGRAILNVTNGDTSRKGNKLDLRDDSDVYAAGFGSLVRFEPTVSEDLDARRTWARAVAGTAARFPAFVSGRSGTQAAERNAAIYVHYTFAAESAAETAERFGMTRERVRQIVLKTRPHFDAWASDVRKEAA